MKDLQKLESGKPLAIHAETFNSMVDASKIVLRTGQHTGAGQPTSKPLEPSRIRLVNASGGDRQRFDVLAVATPAIGPGDNLAQFSREILPQGVLPHEITHYGKFAVLLNPIAEGAIGLAVVDGEVPCRVSIGSRDHQYADVDHLNPSALKSCSFGSAQIIWKQHPDLLGEMLCIVRIGNPPPRPFALEDCHNDPSEPKLPTLYVSNDLTRAAEEGAIVLVEGDTVCRQVRIARCDEVGCLDLPCVRIVAIYPDCSRCQSCWLLTECVLEGEPETIVTNTDLAAYENQVIKIAAEPDTCWVVSHYGLCPSNPTPVVVIGNYQFCSECVCWDIAACDDEANIRKVSNDLFRLAVAAGLLDEEDELDDVISEGIVFEIDGICYFATAYGECSLSSEELEIAAVHDDCTACGCIKLVQCDAPANVIYAHSAVDSDSDPLNLRLLAGQVVRLADGACYQVSIPDPEECDDPQQVTVLEAYANCAACKCYTLYLCGSGDDPGTRIATYTDLQGLGYAVGQTIRVAAGESYVCYVIEDDAANCSEAVGVVPLAQYPDCESCAGDRRYRLTNDCANEGCDGTDEDFTPQADRITNEDLSGAVGQRIRAYGYCWYVSIEPPETPVSSGWEAPVTWYGPYPTCVTCADNTVYPWSHLFDLVEIDEEGRLVRHRYERIVRGPGVESICDRGTTYLCESCEPPTCSQLQLCHSDPAEYLYTQDDLSPAVVNDVLQRQEDGLWYTLVATGVPCGYPISPFTVDDTDTECPEPPELCTRLILCGTEEDEPPTFLFTQSDLSAYEPLDVLERNQDGLFYILDAFDVACAETPVAFTVDSNPEACPEPPETCTELTLCGSGGATVAYTSNNTLTLNKFYEGTIGEDTGCWEVTAVNMEPCGGEPVAFTPASGPHDDCDCGAAPPADCENCAFGGVRGQNALISISGTGTCNCTPITDATFVYNETFNSWSFSGTFCGENITVSLACGADSADVTLGAEGPQTMPVSYNSMTGVATVVASFMMGCEGDVEVSMQFVPCEIET